MFIESFMRVVEIGSTIFEQLEVLLLTHSTRLSFCKFFLGLFIFVNNHLLINTLNDLLAILYCLFVVLLFLVLYNESFFTKQVTNGLSYFFVLLYIVRNMDEKKRNFQYFLPYSFLDIVLHINTTEFLEHFTCRSKKSIQKVVLAHSVK
jgi:hypothetical protein